jgi:RHS repeat-associated protein
MGAADKLYNGNIAETFWSTATDGGFVRNYGYKYDNLSRLKDATYQKSGQLTNMYNENLSYDKNGNIMNLSRNGDRDEQYLPIQIDNLGYTYATNSNKLMSVVDNSNNTSGFKDGITTGDDYSYDANGNMTVDKNKNITGIVYNHLNLPTKIIFPTGNIVYFYTASGQKVQKVVTENATVTTTDYLGGYQYQNTVLQYFPTAEGYVKNTPVSGTNTYSYVFNYTDHLGNVRLSYTKNPSANVLTILDENNYYPFGLKHNGYNSITPVPENRRLYNGKELQQELGLNEYAYGWRDYDPVLGKWNVIDQLAEKYYNTTPYAYVANNPITTIDPDGRYLFGLFGSTSAERKEARAEKYAAKVGGTVVKGENGRVSVNVVRGTADGGMSITTKSNFGDFSTLAGNIKKWTTSHKEQLLVGAKLLQKSGDNLAVAGLISAAAGAPIAGVGAAPGLTTATIGGAISTFGSILEIATKVITNDDGASGDIKTFVAGKIISKGVDMALPGPTPDMSKQAEGMVKTVNKSIGVSVDEKTETISDELNK